MLKDFAFGEDAHANLVSDVPLGDVAVRITTMICEPAYVAFLCGINVLSRVNQQP